MRKPPPRRIAQLRDEAVRRVEAALGVRPDGTPETLGLIDEYVSRAGADAPAGVNDLVAAMLGCYFGEIVRGRFGGWWVLDGEASASWRLELKPCYLYLHPVGMAVEVLRRSEVAGYDGTFATSPKDEARLRDTLAAVMVSEDEYYSFTGRLDTLERVVGWLVEERRRGGRARGYAPEDYAGRA